MEISDRRTRENYLGNKKSLGFTDRKIFLQRIRGVKSFWVLPVYPTYVHIDAAALMIPLCH